MVRKTSNFTIRKLDSFDFRDSNNNNKGIQTITLAIKQKNSGSHDEKILHLSGGHLDSFSAEGRYFQGLENERRKKKPGDMDVFIGDTHGRATSVLILAIRGQNRLANARLFLPQPSSSPHQLRHA
ncbi:MAG: hypothetical protein GY821_16375 [Gammaproteobacteria bacterium]|nr:hypothetical protein [Gammaproteobacteria bacterium]